MGQGYAELLPHQSLKCCSTLRILTWTLDLKKRKEHFQYQKQRDNLKLQRKEWTVTDKEMALNTHKRKYVA